MPYVLNRQEFAGGDRFDRFAYQNAVHDHTAAGHERLSRKLMLRRHIGLQKNPCAIPINGLPALQIAKSNEHIVAWIELKNLRIHLDRKRSRKCKGLGVHPQCSGTLRGEIPEEETVTTENRIPLFFG